MADNPSLQLTMLSTALLSLALVGAVKPSTSCPIGGDEVAISGLFGERLGSGDAARALRGRLETPQTRNPLIDREAEEATGGVWGAPLSTTSTISARAFPVDLSFIRSRRASTEAIWTFDRFSAAFETLEIDADGMVALAHDQQARSLRWCVELGRVGGGGAAGPQPSFKPTSRLRSDQRSFLPPMKKASSWKASGHLTSPHPKRS